MPRFAGNSGWQGFGLASRLITTLGIIPDGVERYHAYEISMLGN
jgi:hypothetical protein